MASEIAMITAIERAAGVELTAEQKRAAETFARFAASTDTHTVMLLRGAAGTGKTTLAGAVVRALAAMRVRTVLMAPTGRAAKVFSLNAGAPAFTIHRRIYRQKSAGATEGSDAAFSINYNKSRDTLFIVDEASMVAAHPQESAFGSGVLLDDLIQYVYSGENCRLMLIGDTAQLPPVGEEESMAMTADTLRGYGLTVMEAVLDEVLRQSADSGILFNATVIRRMITRDRMTQLPKVRFEGFADISLVPGDELIERLASSYSEVGEDETMVITRSNKRANIYNLGIRNQILGREEMLCGGDMIMVVKNHYIDAQEGNLAFIANGDRAIVRRVRKDRELYGFHFADITISFPDYDNAEMEMTAVTDTLLSEAPALTRDQQQRLYERVMEDYADIPKKSDRMTKLKSDRYYNALQIKYAYAVTCHKAQGGQWEHVYVDQGYMTDEMLSNDYIHWLYTAFTRARSRLFLINWPKTQTI